MTSLGFAAPPKSTAFVLFSVEKSDRFTAIDPVARIDRRGTILAPFAPDSDAQSNRFVRQWLKPGTTYRILFGGAPAGVATVRESPGDPGISHQAPSTLRTTAPLRDRTMGLAVGSTGATPPIPMQRRALTAGERSALLRAAQEALRKQGVSLAAAQKATILTSASLNLDRTGRPEIVARIQANETRGKQPRCDLFVIAEPKGAAEYAVTLAVPHRSNGTSEDLNYVEQDFVDALDLDGDGIAEVVTRSVYYESHDYTIYRKRRGGTWRSVYRGAGGGV